MKFKVDDVVLCKVVKIEGTSVFLDVDGFSGTMVLSEVAAGRIRNLRDYVVPKKEVVCKVLKVYPDRLELSLRRVTAKERERVFEDRKKERALFSMLKTIGENPEKIIERIKEGYGVSDFIEEAREDRGVIEKFISREKAEKLAQIIQEKEEKEKIVNGRFLLRSVSGEGLSDVKEILNLKECEIHYLGSSQFSISVSGGDFKEANVKLSSLLQQIEKKAKSKKAFFEIKKER